MIGAVIFDMDGVLLDSESVYEKAWRFAAEKMDLDDIDSVHKKCLGVSEKKVFELMNETYGKNFDAVEFWKVTSDWSVEFMKKNGTPLKNGAKEILIFLKQNKIKIGLATSSEKSFAENLLRMAGLLDFFDEIVFGDEVKKSKPEPDIYLAARKKLGVNAENCFAVEDSPNGVLSAVNAGLKCVMIPDRIPADEKMKNTAWKIFDSLYELKNIFENEI